LKRQAAAGQDQAGSFVGEYDSTTSNMPAETKPGACRTDVSVAREQLDEPSLIRRLDRENVDERDELCVLRDGGHRGSP
jgi:hypothetical protein